MPVDIEVSEQQEHSIWAIYGLRWHDLWNAIFGLPVSISLSLDLLGRIGLSGVLATFLTNWRIDCRRFLDWVAGTVIRGATFSDRDKDAITLAMLSLIAIGASRYFRTGQSYADLLRSARNGRTEFSRRLATFILILNTMVVADYFVLNPPWWAYVAIVVFMLAMSAVPLTTKREPTPEQKRQYELEWHLLQHHRPTRQRFEDHMRFLKILPYIVLCLYPTFIAAILSLPLGSQHDTGSYPIMLIAAGATVALSLFNWKAFAIIFLNALVIVAFDALTMILRPAEIYLRHIVS